jgi:DNA polymerase-3 subunit delta
MADKPVIYILHGDDEYAIAEYITTMENMMGDPTTAEMNIARLDGNTFSIYSLVAAAYAMPFLTERRLVTLTNPLGKMKSPSIREKFIGVLENVPRTTALVVVIHRPLVNDRDKRKGVLHWLQKWAAGQDGRALIREFTTPHGPQMARWIQTKAVELGGEFSHQAAGLLASYVLDDPRLAAQEIQKLLTYANFNRPVEVDDVERLTPYAGEGNVFEMVDAMGNRNGRLALSVLHRLLEEDEPIRLFGMIVRQFRLLILTRELLNAGYREAEITRQLKTYPFVIRKLIGQVRNFSMESLEAIYHQLLEIDEGIKTGQMEWEVALDSFITSLTIEIH